MTTTRHTFGTLGDFVTTALEKVGLPTNDVYFTASLSSHRASVDIQCNDLPPIQANDLAVALGLTGLVWGTGSPAPERPSSAATAAITSAPGRSVAAMRDTTTLTRLAYGYALDLATADPDYPAEPVIDCDMRLSDGWCGLPEWHEGPCQVVAP